MVEFSQDTLREKTGFGGQFGNRRHGDHVRGLASKFAQGDFEAYDRLVDMNEYFDQVGGGYEGAKYKFQDTGGSFDKGVLAKISGYDQTPMYRGFGGTADTAMGKGRHGNYVYDLLAASRGGNQDATKTLNRMNAYFQATGQGGAMIDIDGASFSDKPVNRELRQVTGYTGLFGPDAKAAGQENFGKYVEGLRDGGKFDELAKVNEVLEKYGYESFEISPGETLTKSAQDIGYQGDPEDIDAIGRFLQATGARSSYVDAFGNVTPTGRQELLQDTPELPEGTDLQLQKYEASQDEFLDADKYDQTPTKFNVDAAQAQVSKSIAPDKTGRDTFVAQQVSEEVAKAQTQAARQQGLTDYVEAQKGEVDVNSTIQGQLANLMQQFEGGQVPAFAAGAIRLAEQRLAARGMGASSMAGAAIMQAAMEAATPIAAADAETYRRMSELNLNNRQQAEVLNAQMTLQMDLQNLSNEQQARVSNTQNKVQSLFTDQAATNAARQFNSQSEQQNDQFFANLFNQSSQFNATQTNALAQYNAGQENALEKFNSELASQREQFQLKNRILIDQANAVYRRQINTANTAVSNAEAEFNVQNLFNISQNAQANLLQQHRDELNATRVNALNERDYLRTLALSSFAYDRDLEAAEEIQGSALITNLLGGVASYVISKNKGST